MKIKLILILLLMQGVTYAETSMSDLFNKYSSFNSTIEVDDLESPMSAGLHKDISLIKLNRSSGYSLGWNNYSNKNYYKAANYWRRSALDGNASAQSNIGYLYYIGLGTDEDIAIAKHWTNLAVKAGNKQARINLDIWNDDDR
jgi:TPR repeat protein